jgi:tetratricopeptide (TPR) repeat protein
VRKFLLPFVLVGIGCGQANTERRADGAYAQGRYAEALAMYSSLEAEGSEPRILAKAGAAALRAGELGKATDMYLRLAGEDPTRGREAAAGLEGVVIAAERSGAASPLQEAVLGLQTIAPDAVPGRYALVLAQKPEAEPEELVALLPGAIAAADDEVTVDSLLLRYGRALEATGGCGQALLQYRAVARRAQDSTLRSAARAHTGDCAFTQGLRAQKAGRQEDAVLWFAEASRVDSSSVTGRRALVSLGDLRLFQGDTLAAALAFQTAVSASRERDSIGDIARIRLARLGLEPNVGDTARSDR